jgi:hypothetical protein
MGRSQEGKDVNLQKCGDSSEVVNIDERYGSYSEY